MNNTARRLGKAAIAACPTKRPKMAGGGSVVNRGMLGTLRFAQPTWLCTEEVERWFAYRDNRNTTAHDYGEKFAEETLQLLPEFITDAKRLKGRIDRADA